MPCIQTATNSGGAPAFSGPHKTEADCLKACVEGACCQGTTCTVRRKCECQGTGQTFNGEGTTCSPNPCGTSCKKCGAGLSTWCQSPACIPRFLNLTYSYSAPVRFDSGFGNRYIGAFSASALVTLSGMIDGTYPCGFYGFSTSDPVEAAKFNAGTFGVSIDTRGNYSLSHSCRLVLDGTYSGPQGVWPLYRPTTGSTVGERPVIFGDYGSFEFTPAASGYCYQSGRAISFNNPNGAMTVSVVGSYGDM
jgi:hypothetical protein